MTRLENVTLTERSDEGSKKLSLFSKKDECSGESSHRSKYATIADSH